MNDPHAGQVLDVVPTLVGPYLEPPSSWDNTTLLTYQKCPRKFEYAILRGLRPKSTGKALSFGAAVHEGLAAWYRVAQTHPSDEEIIAFLMKVFEERRDANGNPLYGVELNIPKTRSALREELMVQVALSAFPPTVNDDNETEKRTAELLEMMLRGYAKLYELEPFGVKFVEQNFSFTLPNGEPYSGIIDAVIDFHGSIIALEHKTTSHALSTFGFTFTPNQQVDGYITGLLTLVPNAEPRIIVNALFVPKRKELVIKKEDFQRYPDIKRNQFQLEEFQLNAVATIEDIKKDIQRGFFRQEKSSCHEYVDRNGNGGCPFKDICGKAGSQEERELIARQFFVVNPWNPFKRDEGKDLLT